jgi:hypothetical protein
MLPKQRNGMKRQQMQEIKRPQNMMKELRNS